MPGLPLWLLVAIIALVCGGVASLGVAIMGGASAPQHSGNAALFLTLAAVVAYVYYTHLLAKEAWTPSASFALMPYEPDPFVFLFLIQNHSRASLNCWCRLNAKVCGRPVELKGFYAGKSSFDVQPLGVANGWFSVRELLAKGGLTPDEAEKKIAEHGVKGILYLEIEFWYARAGSPRGAVHNPKQPHFYDFERHAMVADF